MVKILDRILRNVGGVAWGLGVAWCLAASAAGAPVDPDALFARAREAYDAGDLRGAIEAYEALLASGYDAPEVRYNLGNAHFRAGDLPEAVAQYRLALYARPRDPDIAANLHFALERAGAVEPALSLPRQWARRLSRSEWIAIGAMAWGCLGVALAAAFLWPRGRRPLLRAAAGAGFVVLAAAGGWLEWRGLDRRPEAVVRIAGAQARFAPLADATVHFTLPAGSIVRLVGHEGEWVKIVLDGREGWLKAGEVRPLVTAATPSNRHASPRGNTCPWHFALFRGASCVYDAPHILNDSVHVHATPTL